MWKSVLEFQMKSLSSDHPHLAFTILAIGDAYLKQNNLSNALDNYERALDIRLKCLSPTDNRIADNWKKLGKVYLKQQF
jgi:tetratricopeptide (TPR) repeat protein